MAGDPVEGSPRTEPDVDGATDVAIDLFSHGDAGDDASFEPAHLAMRDAISTMVEAELRPIPAWARASLQGVGNRISDVLRFLDAAAHATSVLEPTSWLVESVFGEGGPGATPEDAEHRAREIKELKRSIENARPQVERGFPLLYMLGAVWLWSALEAMLDDLVVAALEHDPSLITEDTLRDLRVPWAVAAAGDRHVLALTVYAELENRKGPAFKAGITRFEGLLAAVQLGGAVPETARRSIFELGNVRNVAMHRGGVADATIVANCPWLGLAIGAEVTVSHHKFEEYAFAAMHYVALIRGRVAARFPE